MAEHDWPSIIQPVAEAFWGEPNKKLSTAKELRWGAQGSRTINPEKACWFDHEAHEGGNVIELVQREAGLGDDNAAAMAWLEQEGFISPSEKPQERRNSPPASETHSEPDQPPQTRTEDDGAKQVAVKGYTYTDADGNPLYQVVRFQWKLPDGSWRLAKNGQIDKTFRQRRKDERGNIVWNLDGIGHTIYRHQQVELAIEAGKAFMIELRKKWQYTAPESEPEKRASELNRVVADAGKKLQIAGFIDRDNEKGLIWWTGKEDRVFVKPAPEPAPDLPADVKRELVEVGNDEPPF